MALCAEYQIPHTEFLSWAPEDRAKALAFLIEKNERCTLCGTAPWEWEEDKYAYSTEEKFCQGCYMKHVSTEGQGRLPGTTVELTRNTPQRKAQVLVREQKRAAARKED